MILRCEAELPGELVPVVLTTLHSCDTCLERIIGEKCRI